MLVMQSISEVLKVTVSKPQKLDGHSMQVVEVVTKDGKVVMNCHLAKAAPKATKEK
jgi:hypothetical protein